MGAQRYEDEGLIYYCHLINKLRSQKKQTLKFKMEVLPGMISVLMDHFRVGFSLFCTAGPTVQSPSYENEFHPNANNNNKKCISKILHLTSCYVKAEKRQLENGQLSTS